MEGKRGGRSRLIAFLRLFFLSAGVSSAASFTASAISLLSVFCTLPFVSILSELVVLAKVFLLSTPHLSALPTIYSALG